MKITKELIVDSCELPLSIIIIGKWLILGLGESDFRKMHVLDGDNGLKDDKGREATRDIVQFVEFNKCKTMDELKEKVLEELPYQYVSYQKS